MPEHGYAEPFSVPEYFFRFGCGQARVLFRTMGEYARSGGSLGHDGKRDYSRLKRNTPVGVYVVKQPPDVPMKIGMFRRFVFFPMLPKRVKCSFFSDERKLCLHSLK